MWNKTLGALLLLGTVSACGSPADGAGAGDQNAESTEDDLTAKRSQSLDTLLAAIAAEQAEGIGADPVHGRLIHKCSSRGVSQRVYLDVYMTEHKIEESPSVVVIRSRGKTFSAYATVTLATDAQTTYQYNDVYIDMEGVHFRLEVDNEGDGGTYFQAAFFDQPTFVCTKGPDRVPMGPLS